MQYLDLTLENLAENLALDEALLLAAEAGLGGEVLRVWEWPSPAIVLGAGGRWAEDVNEAACRADGVPVQRRSSGGGTVLLGRGCLLFSLVLGYERSEALREIGSSYSFILGQIRGSLVDLAPGVEFAGTSDLALAGRKVSGNAQQRKRHFLLHHGTLLYNFDLHLVGRYLRPPRRQPHYRAGREHADFLHYLKADSGALKDRLRAAWQADQEMTEWPAAQVRQLVAERYGREEWVKRR